MKWRAFLAWYDGQICLEGVYKSEKAARRAAKKAVDGWRRGKIFPEWNAVAREGVEPDIKLCETAMPAGEQAELYEPSYKLPSAIDFHRGNPRIRFAAH